MAMDMDSASSIPTELCSALQSFGGGDCGLAGSQTVQYESDKNGGGRQWMAKSDGVIDKTVQYRQPP